MLPMALPNWQVRCAVWWKRLGIRMAKRDKAKDKDNTIRNRNKANSRRKNLPVRKVSEVPAAIAGNGRKGPHFVQTDTPLTQTIGDVLRAAIEASRS
jgi:hypothetical protein